MRIAILVASMILLLGCQKAPKAVVAGGATYDSAAVETRSIEVTVDASGVVEPESTVEVKSKASGEVLKVHGETGDTDGNAEERAPERVDLPVVPELRMTPAIPDRQGDQAE